MKKINLIMTIFAVLIFSGFAKGTQTLPLNTGYDHSVFGPYTTVSQATSNTMDKYWINLASYPTTSPATGPSWVLWQQVPWAPAMSNSSWIGARQTVAGGTGTTTENPGYTIFRKCYCLLPGFNQASLNFQVRVDDKATFWLNSITNSLGTVSGNLGGPVYSASTNNQSWFHAGKNCFYVLDEDLGGFMGFDLVGTITANGLLPTVGSWNGTDMSFEPCPCSSRSGPTGAPNSASAKAQAGDDDQQVISEIVKFAEARRAARQKKQ